jgi:hypothetical protein
MSNEPGSPEGPLPGAEGNRTPKSPDVKKPSDAAAVVSTPDDTSKRLRGVRNMLARLSGHERLEALREDIQPGLTAGGKERRNRPHPVSLRTEAERPAEAAVPILRKILDLPPEYQQTALRTVYQTVNHMVRWESTSNPHRINLVRGLPDARKRLSLARYYSDMFADEIEPDSDKQQAARALIEAEWDQSGNRFAEYRRQRDEKEHAEQDVAFSDKTRGSYGAIQKKYLLLDKEQSDRYAQVLSGETPDTSELDETNDKTWELYQRVDPSGFSDDVLESRDRMYDILKEYSYLSSGRGRLRRAAALVIGLASVDKKMRDWGLFDRDIQQQMYMASPVKFGHYPHNSIEVGFDTTTIEEGL